MFKVQVRTTIRMGKEVPRVSWMKPGKDYPVLDIFKYKDRESKDIITSFLVGDSESGEMYWVSGAGLKYIE